MSKQKRYRRTLRQWEQVGRVKVVTPVRPSGTAERQLSGSCECCGRAVLLWRVAVEAIADGQHATLDLCQRCLDSDGRVWRLR